MELIRLVGEEEVSTRYCHHQIIEDQHESFVGKRGGKGQNIPHGLHRLPSVESKFGYRHCQFPFLATPVHRRDIERWSNVTLELHPMRHEQYIPILKLRIVRIEQLGERRLLGITDGPMMRHVAVLQIEIVAEDRWHRSPEQGGILQRLSGHTATRKLGLLFVVQ